jgi:hypothetical protein
MTSRFTVSVVRLLPLLGIALLMLVPSGMCICSGLDDEGPAEQHEPGCPKVRKIDRSVAPEHYAGDSALVAILAPIDVACPAGPSHPVAAVAHGPPRGQPLYLTHQSLLI